MPRNFHDYNSKMSMSNLDLLETLSPFCYAILIFSTFVRTRDFQFRRVFLYLLPCFLSQPPCLNGACSSLLFKLHPSSLDECMFESGLCSIGVRRRKSQSFEGLIIGTAVVFDPLLKIDIRVVADVHFDGHEAEKYREVGDGGRDVGFDYEIVGLLEAA